ncbi:COP9 signalosome (CSN) subunit, partial [Cryomyces antarcticus]
MAHSIFDDFRRAVQNEDGYLLASTITPRAPEHDGGRLYDFYRTTNHYSVQTDFRYAIVYNNTA